MFFISTGDSMHSFYLMSIINIIFNSVAGGCIALEWEAMKNDHICK